ncbi:sensor histidine kinase [Dactylosporangium sucinum]|uniref:histidine kinase n=1 Tax=Dactylosporangium sucinum TaxID=1424081 RepID=A0A917X359_9ACTN|nr:sensor histidine kinase [Dactylosporangium sucinum]GGM57720.1 two-component sensor histidine kinase [Dactylosporangium sucinum]
MERGSRRGVWRTVAAWTGFVLSPLLFVAWSMTGNPADSPFGLRFIMPIAALAALAGMLRRRPFVALGMLLLITASFELTFHPNGPEQLALHSDVRTIQTLALDVAVGYIAATRRRWVSITTAVLVLCAQWAVAVGVQLSPDDLNDRGAQEALAMLATWFIGNSIRQRRVFAEARLAETAREAAQAERLRIARELHDLIAHSIGVIAMQAGMGRRVIDTQPAEARRALAVIEETGRETLAALRRTLGNLRRTDPAAEELPLAPSNGLADLERLAERSRGGGLRVELHAPAAPVTLPADLDLAAYRVVQESLTNVTRHARATRCDVTVAVEGAILTVEVTDNGRGGPIAEGGHGIAGMRERVTLLGGEFAAGPRPGGGFRVAATIPLPVAPVAPAGAALGGAR